MKKNVPPHLQDYLDPIYAHEDPEPDELAELLDIARCTSVLMIKSDVSDAAPGCWIGGEPTLPDRFDWPWVFDPETTPFAREQAKKMLRKFRPPIFNEPTPRNPMVFCGQINLAHVPRKPDMPDLPATGTLFFFVDYVEHVERFPEHPGYAVIYAEEDVSNCPPRTRPDWPENFQPRNPANWWANNPTTAFPKRPVKFAIHEDWDTRKFPNEIFQQVAGENASKARKAANQMTNDAPHRLFGPPDMPHADDAPSTERLFALKLDPDITFWQDHLGFFAFTEDLKTCTFDTAFAVSLGS